MFLPPNHSAIPYSADSRHVGVLIRANALDAPHPRSAERRKNRS